MDQCKINTQHRKKIKQPKGYPEYTQYQIKQEQGPKQQ